MTFQPYTSVPGTEILHSTTDVYELYDEGYTKGFKVGHDAGWELNEEVSRRGL